MKVVRMKNSLWVMISISLAKTLAPKQNSPDEDPECNHNLAQCAATLTLASSIPTRYRSESREPCYAENKVDGDQDVWIGELAGSWESGGHC